MRFRAHVGAVVVVAACSSAAKPAVEQGLIYTYPSADQIDVPLGASVVITFSSAIEASAVTACTGAEASAAFCVVGPDGAVGGTLEVVDDGKTVRLASAAFAPATEYQVYVRAGLAPTATNLPASGPVFRFTTRGAQPRSTTPAVIAFNGGPTDRPEAFRPIFDSSTLRLVVSEPLDPRSVALAPGALELIDSRTGAAVPATLLAKGIHVSIDPIADLTPDVEYVLKIGNQLVDLGGQPVVASTIAFTPRATGAARPIPEPLRTREVGDRGPDTPHTGANRNVISIDKPLIGKELSRVVPSALLAELGDPKALDGPIAFTLRRGQRLRARGLDVKLGGELPVGLSTGDIVIELVSDGGGRLYRNPHHPDQRPDNARSPLLLDLSMDLAIYAVDPKGNATLSQTVLGVQGSGTVFATDGVLDLEAMIAIDLDLLGVASAPTNLVLELITDRAAILDRDLTVPTLVASRPSAPDDELPVDAGVELIFSEPIDLDRARAGGVALQTAAGQPVASVIESHGAAVVVRPLVPLAYATGYRVVLSDVTDVVGNALAVTAPITFSTPVLAGTTAPLTVASVHPGVPCALVGADPSARRCASSGAGDDTYHAFALEADAPIDVRFTQPAAPASVTHGVTCNTGSARIERLDGSGACIEPVAGTWTLRDRRMTFRPDAPWQLGMRYRLTLVSGNNAACNAGEICGVNGVAASFDPLAGGEAASAGGGDLAIDFVGAAASGGTLVITDTAPLSDVNGSGFRETGERDADANRVALRISGTTGVVTSASFNMPDCLAATPASEACMSLSGAMPVNLLPATHACPLPGGEVAATCVPVVLSPQAMYATSLALQATATVGNSTINLSTLTGKLVMRIREPAGGPITGYLIDDRGTPTVILSLTLYLDAPDMALPLLEHDLHSKPLAVTLRGPLRFLPDGRIAIAVVNVADVAISVGISADGLAGTVEMVIPRDEMKIQLVSPALRGALP